MRWRDFFFCLGIICLAFLIGKIPIQRFLENNAVADADYIGYIITGIIVILVSVFIAVRTRILISGGFLKPNRKNYWMLFLPLLFPGLLFVGKLNFGCYNGWLAIGIAVFAKLARGIMEEVVFRGVIQGYLQKQYPGQSLHKVIFISAAFFAMVHFTNIQYIGIQNVLLQIIYAFYMGLFFGALMVRIKNVWLLGIVHGVLNGFNFHCAEMQDDYLSKIDIGSLLGMILVFSPILIIYWFLMITNKPKPDKPSTNRIV